VIVSHSETKEEDLVGILRASERVPVQVHIVPRLFELGGSYGPLTDDLWGIPVIYLHRPARDSAARFAKRTLDVVIASAATILTAPAFLAAALTVRLSSGKPILFRQTRIGRHGRSFELLKFRTMRVNGQCDTAWDPESDDQFTAVGRFLRRTSLDELPQLINVLRGDMSVVGPRPERPHFVERFRATVPRYDDRHRVPTGITGWAQIHGRSRALSDIPERVRFDNQYIDHWSVWTDLVILVRTIKHIVTESGR
jgi:exopolysaccharide biosynthesis polyprenyl glycosylphosphotransferase